MSRANVSILYNSFVELYNSLGGIVSTGRIQAKLKELGVVSTFEALRVFRENGLLEQVKRGKYRVLNPSLYKITEGFKALSAASKKRQTKHMKRVKSGRVRHTKKYVNHIEVEEPQYAPSIEECISILTKEGYIIHKLSEGETLTFTKTLKG